MILSPERLRRLPTALAVILAMTATACGPTTPEVSAPAVSALATFAPVVTTTQAAPPPAAIMAPVVVPDVVDLKEPTIEVVPPAGSDGEIWAAVAAEGVDALTAVRHFEGTLVAVSDDKAIEIAAVDPNAFRPFTPEATAQAPAVWERLHAGEALVRHDVAHELGLELGGTIFLMTDAGNVTLRIGAFASNGAPPIADVIVPWDVGEALGHPEVTRLFVAIKDGARSRTVERALVEALGGGLAARRETPTSQQAQLSTRGSTIESFSYKDNGDGTIVIDSAWVASSIVRVDLPVVGRTYVHKVMAPQLLAAMAEVERAGLSGHFDRAQFGGGWVARHIDWNPAKPLSMHAWGLAVDFNTRDNALGATPQMDQRIVEIFDRWGFAWGGRWSRPDGMHFEFAQLVHPG